MNYFKHEQALVHPQAQIGEGTRIWAFANIQSGARIGAKCNICDGCFVVFDGVTIENDVFLGAHATFINDLYPRSNRKDAWEMTKTLVKQGATIGANATILGGITIGEYAMVGAGAVVTKDVAAYTVVIGNPAKNAGYACSCGRKLEHTLQCSCGLKYTLEKSKLSPKP
jgi:acetyltransferase-like isoleucine patch superfamily enzyme